MKIVFISKGLHKDRNHYKRMLRQNIWGGRHRVALEGQVTNFRPACKAMLTAGQLLGYYKKSIDLASGKGAANDNARQHS